MSIWLGLVSKSSCPHSGQAMPFGRELTVDCHCHWSCFSRLWSAKLFSVMDWLVMLTNRAGIQERGRKMSVIE